MTKTGTFILNGIEWNELPPPKCLVKTMSRQWAQKLVNNGVLRMRHLEYYRNWENSVLGDPNDGNALLHLDSRPMNNGSGNDVYAWCASYPSISNERINLIAEQSKYDCLLVIKKPRELFQVISQWLSSNMPGFVVHCGAAHYNRGEEVDKSKLNSQKFHFNVFQKSALFSEDIEYRLSVTNDTIKKLENDYLDLELGNCREFMSIEELPNK